MGNSNAANCIVVMQQLISSQESLIEYHSKIDAMVEMMLAKDLTEYPLLKLHNYLWALGDLVSQAKDLNEDLMQSVTKVIGVLRNYENQFFDGAES